MSDGREAIWKLGGNYVGNQEISVMSVLLSWQQLITNTFDDSGKQFV